MALDDEYSAEDAAQVMSLVHQYIVSDLSTWSYVYPHKRLKTDRNLNHCYVCVGGYWRRSANCRHVLRAIPCVCKMTLLADTKLPPPRELWQL